MLSSTQLQKICDDSIQLLDQHLIPQSTDTETTVVYKKMLADYYSYIAEFTHDEANRTATENAELTYQDVAGTARAGLPHWSNIRRGMTIQRYQHGWSRGRSSSRSSESDV